jgi:3-deoxy-manno-octulosonate cytidylyltransferase (CMP-KDO synthetase)
MKTPKVLAVIPARMQSSRFPGKALANVAGKTLLERLYEEAVRAKMIDRVAVATDSAEVARAVKDFGGEYVMTSSRHRTGTDRTAEAAEKLGGNIIMNIQADHLGVKSVDYDRVIKAMQEDIRIKHATFARKIDSEKVLLDPNRVKLVIGSGEEALWFTRFPIPFLHGSNGNRVTDYPFYYHVGVYFFRKAALQDFHHQRRTTLEKAESLEQLRILEHGGKIKVFKLKREIYSIDALEDLELLRGIDN